MSKELERTTIEAQSGTSFILKAGALLKVIDPMGEQVADFACFSLDEPTESLSSGCSIDYNETIFLTRGHKLYSNRGRPILEIVEDSVGQHDILLAPCSSQMFEIFHGKQAHPSCKSNLVHSLAKHGILSDQVATTFNIFMNVTVDSNGRLRIGPPRSKAGDFVVLRALVDLIVGLTACSDEQTNNGFLKPISYVISAS